MTAIYLGPFLPSSWASIFVSVILGRDLTDSLMKILTERGYSLGLPPPSQQRVRSCVTSKRSCVVLPLSSNKKWVQLSRTSASRRVTIDGQVITIGNEPCRCHEAMFQPSSVFLGMVSAGMTRPNTILSYEVRRGHPPGLIRQQSAVWWLHRVRICTPTQSYLVTLPCIQTGIADRMHKEITLLAPFTMKIKIIAPPEGKYSVWIEGSILSSLSPGPFQQI